MATCNKVTTGRRDDNCHNQKVINTIRYTHKSDDKGTLGTWGNVNLGPRGSKDKVFKLKRN